MSELKREGSTWPPTIPVLVAMLAPTAADAGMPDAAAAWREATQNAHRPTTHRWSHEAVRLAGQAVGWWELTHTSSQSALARMERRFEKQYAALANRVLSGEQLVARELLGHEGSESPAAQAERAGHRAAQQAVEAAGLPHAMNANQGMRSLRAALGR